MSQEQLDNAANVGAQAAATNTTQDTSQSHSREGGNPGADNGNAPAAQHKSDDLDSRMRGNDGGKDGSAGKAGTAGNETGSGEQGKADTVDKPDPLHLPAQKADDIKLQLPEGFPEDKAMTTAFQELCVKARLTPAQAQALVDWQLKNYGQAQERMFAEGQKALSAKWGGDYELNRQKALECFHKLDRKMDMRLSAGATGKAIANSPDFIELMHALSPLVGSEDALGGFEAGGGGGMSAESKIEHLNKLFKNGN